MAFTDNSTGGRVMQQGIMPYHIVLNDTCNVGDPIGWDETSAAWEQADADGKILCSFIAGERCHTVGDTIVVFRKAIISGITEAAIGDPVYLSNDAGAYSAYPGSWIQQQVGTCLSTTEALLEPSCMSLFSFDRDGVAWGGQVRAALLGTNVTQDQIWGGLRVDIKAESTATIASDAYGLYIFSQLEVAPAASSAFIRLENGNSAGCQLDAYFTLIPGSVGPDFFMDLGGDGTPTGGCWNLDTNTPSGQGGHLKVRVAGLDRYITLFTAHGG